MQNEMVFLQGELVPRSDARVSAFDAGLLHSVGLFETMIALDGDQGKPGSIRVYRLEQHLDRLTESAATLGLSTELRIGPLADAIRLVASRSGLARARVRLTVTGGDLNMLESGGRSNHTPTILVSAQAATAYPSEMFDSGIMVTIGDAKLNPLDPMAGNKTLNYWMRLRELQQASSKGAGEALMLQVTNHIASGCVSNLFVVRDGCLLTPIARGEEEQGGVPSPVLPGITRGAIIELAASQRIPTTQRMLTVDDVLDADEMFLTNSSWGVLPVVRVEQESIGPGSPGEVTSALRTALMNAIDSCSSDID